MHYFIPIISVALILVLGPGVSADNAVSDIDFESMGYGGSLCRILVRSRLGDKAYITCERKDGGYFSEDYCQQWIKNYGPVISQKVADRLDVGFENGEIIYKNPDGKGDVNIYTIDSLGISD